MTDLYADVVVDVTAASIEKSYQYRIPYDMRDEVRPGSCVTVPFGKGNRTADGYVIRTGNELKVDPEKINVKSILRVRNDRLSIESRLIELAVWMKDTYGSSLNNALKAVLPVKEKEKEPRKEKISLAVSPEKAEELLSGYRRKHYKARARLVEFLLENAEADKSEILKKLNVTGSCVSALMRDGVIKTDEFTAWRMPPELAGGNIGGAAEPAAAELTDEQRDVFRGIISEWEGRGRPCLIQGVTGSGKTLVYIELIRKVLSEGRQAIVLIPEIALTWQTVRKFQQAFGGSVTVMNSRMSRGERSDQFERAKRGDVKIAVGPRSALFVPFASPGLIIIDEEQENSYRSGNAPRYDARMTALKLADMTGAHVVFGSATPSVDVYYMCEKNKFALFRLKHRYGNASLPEVSCVDMRKELKAGSRSIISRTLSGKIAERLGNKEQVMLFLNRRGYSGFVSCRSCGMVLKCPHCDVPLTYHRNGKLVCHYCGYETGQVSRCPGCGSPFIGGYRAGTEKVEAEVHRLFPDAVTVRMDADTTRKKGNMEKILDAFAGRRADILIGTQMIVKGHDFPGVTLVGVLAADLSLYAADYRAAERTYQLIVQAAGRAGRGEKPGEAVIQTYAPDNYSIQAAMKQDYDAFFREEIAGREMLDYPPVSNLLAIHGAGQDEERLGRAMKALARFLRRYEGENTQILGPAPENVSKIKDSYRSVLYVKERSRERAVRIRTMAEKYIEINSGFSGMFFQYDLNA